MACPATTIESLAIARMHILGSFLLKFRICSANVPSLSLYYAIKSVGSSNHVKVIRANEIRRCNNKLLKLCLHSYFFLSVHVLRPELNYNSSRSYRTPWKCWNKQLHTCNLTGNHHKSAHFLALYWHSNRLYFNLAPRIHVIANEYYLPLFL